MKGTDEGNLFSKNNPKQIIFLFFKLHNGNENLLQFYLKMIHLYEDVFGTKNQLLEAELSFSKHHYLFHETSVF